MTENQPRVLEVPSDSFKIGFGFGVLARSFLGRILSNTKFNPQRPVSFISYLSFGMFSGMSFRYLDWWRQSANNEMMSNSQSSNYLSSLYEYGDSVKIDLVQYYQKKLENEG